MKTTIFALAAAVTVSAAAASATTYTVVSGNDCGRGGFDNCRIFDQETGPQALIKFDPTGGSYSVNDVNSTFGLSGSLFSFTKIDSKAVEWTYTPGSSDPVLEYAVVKAGPNWAWTNDFIFEGGVYSGTLSTVDAELPAGRGNGNNGNGNNGNGNNLNSIASNSSNNPDISHITFFGSPNNGAGDNGFGGDGFGGDSVPAVPLPAAAWLLLTALGGLAVAGRRRARSA